MQKINEASMKWSHEENEKKLALLKNEYDSKIEHLNEQIEILKKEAEVNKQYILKFFF